MPASEHLEERILVLAPQGRDASVIVNVIDRDGLSCQQVETFDALCKAVTKGAAAALITEEALSGADIGPWRAWLAAQEPWSDFPLVILLAKKIDQNDARLKATLAPLGNVILLERPLSAETLRSAALSALRARRRQYQARTVLMERQKVSEELVALNATLEERVQLRTRALAQANDRLTAEIIERENAQRAMMQYQKMESLGRLTGGVAHDFNNILSVIQNNMELLQLLSTDEKVRHRAEIAKAACGRGARLTAQLLAFARNQRLDMKPVRLESLFDDVAQLVKPLLGPDVELVLDVSPEADSVLADTTQLEMALVNLIINARDALATHGRILVKARQAQAPAALPAPPYICIAVSDNGSGMSQEVSAKVFEPFFTTKGPGKGTGLGLSQVYGMAQQSGGMARVESAPGEGTTVEIWLQAARAGDRLGATGAAADSPVTRATVLVVEDDDAVRASVADALNAFGYDVIQSSNGEEALLILAQRRPDILVTDYLMPGITGADLARAATGIFPGLPVIVATGYADMEAVEHAVGDGVVLRKPFHIEELNIAIKRALSAAPAGPVPR
jgi:signal transduction histidine kinase/ActR/RegA family two-component response regulator